MIGFFTKKKNVKFELLTTPEKMEHTKICLSYSEILSMSTWVKEHSIKCKLAKKDKLIFALDQQTEGGIGLGTDVRCSCGEKFDITDYECW